MATFYRRIQLNRVLWGVRVSLADLATALVLGVGTWMGVAALLDLFEVAFQGRSLVPAATSFYVFYQLLGWFRKEGDGVLRKDGRFRYMASRRINRVLVPDRKDAVELFLVVHSGGKEVKEPWLTRFSNSLAYGLGLKKKPLASNHVPGSLYCAGLDWKDR